jgi:glycerophosphoryl diester phosphodiesterase
VKPPIKAPPDYRIIAHRGASAYAPENTMAAFELADEMGAVEFELDARLSLDGIVVLCHDNTLARYGHGSDGVETFPWQALSKLDMGSWFSPFLFGGERMLRLEDLFRRFELSITYHIEIKGDSAGLPGAIHHQIDRFDLEDRCFITSFSYQALQDVRSLAPHARLGWLVDRIDPNVLAAAAALDAAQICPNVRRLDGAAVELAHRSVKEVRAWGLQGTRQEVLGLIQRSIETGCDGVTTNWPDWITH